VLQQLRHLELGWQNPTGSHSFRTGRWLAGDDRGGERPDPGVDPVGHLGPAPIQHQVVAHTSSAGSGGVVGVKNNSRPAPGWPPRGAAARPPRPSTRAHTRPPAPAGSRPSPDPSRAGGRSARTGCRWPGPRSRRSRPRPPSGPAPAPAAPCRYARVELGGEGGDPGPLVGARCHHDVVGLKAVLPGRHDVPVLLPGEPIHAHAGSNREIEPGRVGLQIVRRLTAGTRPRRRLLPRPYEGGW
jgi:hypothetical protein